MIGTAAGLVVGLSAVAQIGVHLKGHRPAGLLAGVGIIGFGFGLFATVMAFIAGFMAEYPHTPVPWWQCEIAIFACVIVPTVLTGVMGLVFVRDRRAEELGVR